VIFNCSHEREFVDAIWFLKALELTFRASRRFPGDLEDKSLIDIPNVLHLSLDAARHAVARTIAFLECRSVD
jgi:hypothetical protein